MPIVIFRGKNGELLGDRFRLFMAGQGSFGEVWRATRISDGKMLP